MSSQAYVGRTRIQTFVDICRDTLKSRKTPAFRGLDGDDWDAMHVVMKDSAVLAELPTLQALLKAKPPPSSFKCTSSELRQCVTALKTLLTPGTNAYNFVDATALDIEAAPSEVVDGEAYITFKGLLSMLRKMSRQDDSMKYWVEKMAKLTVGQVTDGVQTPGAWLSALALDQLFDRLVRVQEQVSAQKGSWLKPSSLDYIGDEMPDWQNLLITEQVTLPTGQMAQCGKGDDPIKVVQAAIDQTKTAAEENRKLIAALGTPQNGSPQVQELKDATAELKEYENRVGQWESTLLPQVQTDYAKAKANAKALEAGEEIRRRPVDYDDNPIEEGDVRLMRTDNAYRVKVFLAKCPRTWKSAILATGAPLRSLQDVCKAVSLWDELMESGHTQGDTLGAPNNKTQGTSAPTHQTPSSPRTQGGGGNGGGGGGGPSGGGGGGGQPNGGHQGRGRGTPYQSPGGGYGRGAGRGGGQASPAPGQGRGAGAERALARVSS